MGCRVHVPGRTLSLRETSVLDPPSGGGRTLVRRHAIVRRELVGARRTDDTRWVAVIDLEGDFPGGVADLEHSFVLDGDLVSELRIR